MATAATMAAVAPLMPTGSNSSRGIHSRGSHYSRSATSFAGQPLMALGSLPVLGLALSRPATAGVVCAATKEGKEQDTQDIAKQKAAVETPESDVDSVTRKFGLEAGLWKVCFSASRVLLLFFWDKVSEQSSFRIAALHSFL